jgi:hypothetical protein
MSNPPDDDVLHISPHNVILIGGPRDDIDIGGSSAFRPYPVTFLRFR